MTLLVGETVPPATELREDEPRAGIIYRSGGTNPGNFKIRPGEHGVSFTRFSFQSHLHRFQKPTLL